MSKILSSLFLGFFLSPFLVWICLQVFAWVIRKNNAVKRQNVLQDLNVSANEHRRLVGFFHPYCNAGGGGERVLWSAIAVLQTKEPQIISIIYSGDIDATKMQILDKVKARFDIELDPARIYFVFLHSRKWIEDLQWPYFTLLGQSLGSIYLAYEAMSNLVPDLYIDTMGYAFTFHVVSFLGRIPVGAYVHYPTISTDMLARVRSRKNWHTNTPIVSSSAFLSRIKLLYYRIFMYYYASSLRATSFLMVNSSWTKSHIDTVLQHNDILLDALHLLSPTTTFRILNSFCPRVGPLSSGARVVYPPCDTRKMSSFPLINRQPIILSIAQFRPEKDHPAQLRAFAELLNRYPEHKKKDPARDPVKLLLIGGSRNEGDARRIAELRKLAQELKIVEYIEFVVNAAYPVILEWLSKASIGLSTMVDEHFGINIVEFMAAGIIPVAHASGGPLKDIIVLFNGQPTGYHAKSTEEFAEALNQALSLPQGEEIELRHRARTWAVQRFSEAEFERGWNASGWRDWVSA